MVLRALMRWCHLKWAGVAALLVLNVQCGVPNQNSEPKIYGGSKTPLGGWNIVVALTLQNKGIYCTGTAITPQLIVTAAHCLKGENPRNISVYVGSGAEEGRAIGQYQVHKMAINPLYEGEFSEGYDFGYIVLGQPLPLSASEYVEPLIDLTLIPHFET